MRMIQSRRRFLNTLSLAGAVALTGVQKSLAVEAPLETTTVRLSKNAGICIAPQYIAEELLRAEGFTDVQYMISEAGAVQATMVAQGHLDFQFEFRSSAFNTDRCRSAGHGPGRCTRRVLRTVRERAHSQHHGSEGQKPGHSRLRFNSSCVGGQSGRSGEGYRLGDHEPISETHGAFRRRKDRCVPRLSTRATATTRPEYWPRDLQQFRRPPMVAILLLHAVGQ